MRSLCMSAAIAAFLIVGQAPAFAAEGVPQRPGDPLVPVLTSENGGDNGWGNCGHNSSGGQAQSDPDGAGRGNGGYVKGDCIDVIIPTFVS